MKNKNLKQNKKTNEENKRHITFLKLKHAENKKKHIFYA